jgi:hypothetical protein
MHLYGGKLFGFESNGFAAMGKFFIPCNIIMLAFVAVDHVSGHILRLICHGVYINNNEESNDDG